MEIKIYDVRCHLGDSAFLLDNGKTSVLYDSGFGFTGYAVAENIKKILGERKLDYIFLTHSHYDHALGSAYVLEYWNDAVVVAGSYAANIFSRDGAKKLMRELDGKFAAECGVGEYEFLGDKLRVDVTVEDGDIIKAGDMTFEAVALPGHTKCSFGFYCKDEKLLLSSETLGVYDGDETVIPSFLVGYGMSLESMKKIRKYDIDKILIPHVGVICEEKTKYFLSVMEERASYFAKLIAEFLKQGKEDSEIVEYFVKTYRKGYIEKIYPIDAMHLNLSIMIKLIKNEFAIE